MTPAAVLRVGEGLVTQPSGEDMHLEPLPQTQFALAELSRYEEEEYRDLFGKVVTNVGIVAPECVGLTVSFVRDGLAFTWLASSVDVAALDAVQYLTSGPCLEAMELARIVATSPSDDPLDERCWALFSQSENCVGVRSTLSIPLVTAGAGSMEAAKVYGGVNLYGGAVTAFEGLHETLAAICGGWAQGAVTNADLSLSGVRRAKHAPQMMLDQFAVDQAVGMIMAAQHLNSDAAGRKLREASNRAGIHEAELARLVVKTRLL